jgi:hypothetical protein
MTQSGACCYDWGNTAPAETLVHRNTNTELPNVCGTHLKLAVCTLAAASSAALPAAVLQGWEYGVASDTDPEWHRRCGQLRAYHRQHGDTSVGFRDGDDPELAR